MKRSHDYAVRFNGGDDAGRAFALTFGATKDIRLVVGRGSASVSFAMGTLKTAEDLISFRLKLFRDAYRKVHLLHLLLNGNALEVKSIEIEFDGDVSIFSETDEHFPYMFSMFGDSGFELSDGWRSDAVLDQVAAWTKTASDADYRCCAMNAFLVSKVRQYRIDRFLNLWTSMNAVYNQNALRYELAECAYLGKLRSELTNKEKAFGVEEAAIGALLMREFGFFMPMGFLKSDDFLSTCRSANRLIALLDYGKLSEAYDEAKGNLENVCLGRVIPDELYRLAVDAGVPLYIFLTVLYPYWLRCNFFHGSRPIAILSAYNDPEMLDFGVSSFFLDKYLDETIPKLFDQEEIMDDDGRALIERYLYRRKKEKKDMGV